MPTLFSLPLPPRRVCVAIGLALAALVHSGAQANPSGAQVVQGQASFNTQGNTLNITTSPQTILNWQQFSINAGEITRFIQQNATSTVLNRVISGHPSTLLGQLQSNGRVILINPNGILFGDRKSVV